MQWKNEVLEGIGYDPIKCDWITECETPDSVGKINE